MGLNFEISPIHSFPPERNGLGVILFAIATTVLYGKFKLLEVPIEVV